jgi:conjugative relaxase-like TrwC/TraI family protein
VGPLHDHVDASEAFRETGAPAPATDPLTHLQFLRNRWTQRRPSRRVRVVTIGKLGKGQQRYYLESVADGIDDYYSGEGEAPGRWLGAGTAELELEGRVYRGQLNAVLTAHDPRSGERLPRRLWKNRTPGFDVTFSAPKSVSVLWATGDEQSAARIRDAHERSVAAALAYLEREAAFTRVGSQRAAAAGSGFVAAAFRHRMSRAGDPQLHTHVLVANLIRTADGQWRALDGQRIYRRAKTAGYLYQAQLRAELGRELGVRWREVHRGAAEIAGVPDGTLAAFSRRRREIEAHMSARGGSSRRSAEVAALESRRGKDYAIAAGEMRCEWRERAAASGFDLAMLRSAGRPAEAPAESRLFAQVETALTADQSTFARRHVVEQLAARLRAGAGVGEIESLADRFLARSHVHELGEARPAGASPASAPEALYTTRDVLALEQRLAETAARQAARRLAVAERRTVEAALARDPALASEQRELVRRLALDGEGTVCVLGRAGSGKTRTLRPLREAFEACGVEVIGAASQNTAARILEQEAGIRSTSLTRLLYEAEVRGYGLPPGGVVVIDEAATASTRTLARLQELAERDRAKLVLIGDPEQLPAIESPGGFRALVDRLDAVELRGVRRLSDPIERAAVELVRLGRGAAALAAYEERGQLTLAESLADLEAMLAADRHAAHLAGEDAIVLCRTRARAGRLNELCQELRRVDGELGELALQVGESRIHVGDQVVTRVNRGGRWPVHNRERWTVEAIDAEARRMILRHRVEADRVVRLGADYLDRRPLDASGPVELGYAITKYGAQGMTVDRTLAVLCDGLSKEDAYTTMTRARQATALYGVAREPVERAEIAPAADERRIGMTELGRQIERSEQRAVAIDESLRCELEGEPTARLIAEHRQIDASADDPARRRAQAVVIERTKAEREAERARSAVERATTRAERLRLGAILEHSEERVARLRSKERAAEPPATVEPFSGRERAAAIERILAERRRLQVEAAIRLEPAYLVDALGPRPEGLCDRLEWERAVDALEGHRQRLGVRDHGKALGVVPADAGTRAEWRDARRELEAMRVRIAGQELSRARGRAAEFAIER